MTDKPQRQITAGPSREELFDALRLRHENRKVSFTLAPNTHPWSAPKKVQVFVDGISIEDGSGANWLLKIRDEYQEFTLGTCQLEGYYNTTRREGWTRPS